MCVEVDAGGGGVVAGDEGIQRDGAEAAARGRAPAVRSVARAARARGGRGRGEAALQPGAGAAERVRGESQTNIPTTR